MSFYSHINELVHVLSECLLKQFNLFVLALLSVRHCKKKMLEREDEIDSVCVSSVRACVSVWTCAYKRTCSPSVCAWRITCAYQHSWTQGSTHTPTDTLIPTSVRLKTETSISYGSHLRCTPPDAINRQIDTSTNWRQPFVIKLPSHDTTLPMPTDICRSSILFKCMLIISQYLPSR